MADPDNDSTYARAIAAIDAAHALDPTTHTLPTGETMPYELHYAQQMTSYLFKLCSSSSSSSSSDPPSHALTLAIRAQHFRRWEVPRSTYPAGRTGYLRWRTDQKSRAATQVRQLCVDAGVRVPEAERVASLIRKENLKKPDDDGGETQILEDVACLVFLDDQFDDFEKGFEGGEDKMLGILRKTWAKMSNRAREEALKIEVGEKGRVLLGKALTEGDGGGGGHGIREGDREDLKME